MCVCVHTLLASDGLSPSLLLDSLQCTKLQQVALCPQTSVGSSLKKPLLFAFHSFFLFCSQTDGCAVHVSPPRSETTYVERLSALLKSTA